jgi:hypothetical protein
MGVYFTGVYLVGVYLVGMHLTRRVPHGRYLVGVHLTGRVPYRRVPHGRVPHRPAPHWARTSLGVRLMGVYLTSVYFVSVHLTGRASHRTCASWACTSLGVHLRACISRAWRVLRLSDFSLWGFWEKAAAKLARFSTLTYSALPLSWRLSATTPEDRPHSAFFPSSRRWPISPKRVQRRGPKVLSGR